MQESILTDSPGYDELARRYDFGRPVIERLARIGVIVGGRIGGRGKWTSTADYILLILEGRQAPLVGATLDAARKTPLTTTILASRLGLSAETIRDMLNEGRLPGWHLSIPEHLRGPAGKKVCERWYIDEDRLADYRRKAFEMSFRRRFGLTASDAEFPVSKVG